MRRSAALIGLTLAFTTMAQAQSTTDLPALLDLLAETTNLPTTIHGQLPVKTGDDWQARVELDRQRLQASLLARGYLDAEVTVLPPQSVSQGTPDGIDVRVMPGQPYVIEDVQLLGINDAVLLEALGDVGATVYGQPAQSGIGEALTDRLVWELGEYGYAFADAKFDGYYAKPDSPRATIAVTVEPGALSYFTGVNLSRVESADLDWVTSRLPFKPGELFSIDALAQFREELLGAEDVERARVDVLKAGLGEFSLQVRFQRAYQIPPRTPQVEFGAVLLAAVVLVIGLRQTLIADRTRYANTTFLDVTIATMMTVAAALVGLRIATFLQ